MFRIYVEAKWLQEETVFHKIHNLIEFETNLPEVCV